MKKLFIAIPILLLAAACNKQTAQVQPVSPSASQGGLAQNQQMKGIVVEQPVMNQEVQLPITVKGYLDGQGWSAFEGVAGNVQVFDANNKAVSEIAPLQITGDWMKFPAYFEATVGDREMMSHLATQTGVLVFKSEEEKDGSNIEEFRLPIKFANSQTANWKTYSSAQYGFKVNIPADWIVESNSQGLTFVSASTKQKQDENAKNCTAENQYKNCMSDGVPSELSFYNVAGSKTDIQPGSLKTQTINSIKWTTFIGLGMIETQMYEADLNGKVYVFNLTNIDASIFNKILSSFQIIK